MKPISQRLFILSLFVLLVVYALPVSDAVGARRYLDLSGLSPEIQKSIKGACGYYRRTEGPTSYARCITKQLERFGSALR